MTREAARDVIRETLLAVAPDADPDTLRPGENIREAFGLDSIDFLAFIERLSNRTGHRIEEDDYDELSTLESAIDFFAK
jgi:acyl carrier protein